MAIVLIERITPRALVIVKNVFGFAISVNTMITAAIAMTMPPTRRPAASARLDIAAGDAAPWRTALWLSVIPGMLLVRGMGTWCWRSSGRHDVAAVDVDRLAGEVGRGVGQHPRDDARHLLGRRRPLERDEPQPLLAELLVRLAPQ